MKANSKKSTRIEMPNFILVAGNGRNVGKTWFCRQLIKHLSKSTKVTAIKISAHFHPYNENDVLIKTNDFVIIEEKNFNNKDSSLMLQAGAQKVYFVMAYQQHLQKAFFELKKFLPQHAIICESGGLHEIISPGLFFFVNKAGDEIIKIQHLVYSPVLINNTGQSIDFDIKNIHFCEGKFTIQK